MLIIVPLKCTLPRACGTLAEHAKLRRRLRRGIRERKHRREPGEESVLATEGVKWGIGGARRIGGRFDSRIETEAEDVLQRKQEKGERQDYEER